MVLDEYGGLVGIVTMNDLLEQLVGNLEEEITPQEQEQVEFQKIGVASGRSAGGVSLETVAEELEVDRRRKRTMRPLAVLSLECTAISPTMALSLSWIPVACASRCSKLRTTA